jgi:hypothetical protein
VVQESDFSPELFPQKPFLPTELDPILVQSQWDMIRGRLEMECQRIVGGDNRPRLTLAFEASEGANKEKMLRAVLADPGSDVIKASLAEVFKYPRDAYSTAREVHATALVKVGDLRKEFTSEGSIHLVAIRQALLDLLQANNGPLSRYPIEVQSRQHTRELEAITSWVFFKEVTQPKRIRYAWRINVRVSETSAQYGYWEITTTVDLGRQAQGSAMPEKFGTDGIHTGLPGFRIGVPNDAGAVYRQEIVTRYVRGGTGGRGMSSDGSDESMLIGLGRSVEAAFIKKITSNVK